VTRALAIEARDFVDCSQRESKMASGRLGYPLTRPSSRSLPTSSSLLVTGLASITALARAELYALASLPLSNPCHPNLRLPTLVSKSSPATLSSCDFYNQHTTRTAGSHGVWGLDDYQFYLSSSGLAAATSIPYFKISWSLCVEEHFYLASIFYSFAQNLK